MVPRGGLGVEEEEVLVVLVAEEVPGSVEDRHQDHRHRTLKLRARPFHLLLLGLLRMGGLDLGSGQVWD